METTTDWFKEGNDWRDKGEFLKAIECYDEAIRLKPDDAAAYNNKGVALSALGRKEEAIECYDEAIRLKPDNAAAYNNKGNALSALGRKEEAIACYDEAIKRKPDDATAYNNKGNALSDLGRYSKAAECFHKADTDILLVYTISPETAQCMLDNDDLFKNIIKQLTSDEKKGKMEFYKDIYLSSLEILTLLQVKEDKNEENVSHYTKKSTTKILLFDGKTVPTNFAFDCK